MHAPGGGPIDHAAVKKKKYWVLTHITRYYYTTDSMHAPGGGPIDMGALVGSLLATMQRNNLVLRVRVLLACC